MSSTSDVVRLRKFNGTREESKKCIGSTDDLYVGCIGSSNDSFVGCTGSSGDSFVGCTGSSGDLVVGCIGCTDDLINAADRFSGVVSNGCIESINDPCCMIRGSSSTGVKFGVSDILSKESVARSHLGTSESQSSDQVGHESVSVGSRARVVSREVSESGSDVVKI